MSELRVGCSGWNYASWKGRFYATDLPVARWLSYYATVFDTVEINNTFYRLPDISTFARWREQTPEGFLIASKASRFLTHVKRLREPEEPVARLFARVRALGKRLGPILYQLPPNMPADLQRLEGFLRALPRDIVPLPRGTRRRPLQHVIEFRHTSWYTADVFALLQQHGVALCLHDKAGSALDRPFVGPHVYVRFHGASGDYRGSYTGRALSFWAGRLVEQWRDGRDVYAYFNNDPEAVATRNAQTLKELIARRAARA